MQVAAVAKTKSGRNCQASGYSSRSCKEVRLLGFPSKLEEFNIDGDGSIFLSGKLGDIVADSMKGYSGLINVETLSSTSHSKDFILDMLNWGAPDMHLTFTEDMIRHWVC